MPPSTSASPPSQSHIQNTPPAHLTSTPTKNTNKTSHQQFTPPSSKSAKPASIPPTPRTLKWYSSIDSVFSPDGQPIPPDQRERFYLDLYCLKIDRQELIDKLDQISVEQLLDVYQQNLNDLIGYGILCLKNASLAAVHSQSTDQQPEELDEMDQLRLPNALETLSIVFRQILKKSDFENFSVDVIKLTAGSIENSDQVFSDFVASIDMILTGEGQDLQVRHKTLQLALSVVSAINQGSINAYFLRRDLFNTLASLIASPQTISLTFDSVLLLGLLANFRRSEARNPYLVRMEDYVDEKAMERIIALTVLALEDLRLAYVAVKPESGSLLGQVTSSVLGALTSPLLGRHATRPASHAFERQPGLPSAILLPIYDLLCANAVFGTVLVSNTAFWEKLLAFASFLLSHASANARAETYARLVLRMFTTLAEEHATAICGLDGQKVAVEFCRQRLPPLSACSDAPRAPIAAMLDCTVLYLRHNLQLKLKMDGHSVCLRLVHQLLFCLQSNALRLDGFEWRELWRALVGLGGRVGGRAEETAEAEGADRLAQQILDVLSFAAIWADTLFVSRAMSAVLFFEILRADHTIKRLIEVAGAGTGSMNSSAGASTIEAAKNLETIVAKCRWMMSSGNAGAGGGSGKAPGAVVVVKRAEEGMEVIERRLDEIGLIDSASLESHLRKCTESENRSDYKKFINLVADDVFQLMV